jgi:F0F1-type ATP synthase assembly protein I
MTRENEYNPDEKTPEPRAPTEFPEPPDPARVQELREQMRKTQSERAEDKGFVHRRLERTAGHKARDIGTYTLIPMLMLAGPAVGYILGLLVQNRWGGEPWGAVIGMLVGLVAGFRQVFLLLARFGKNGNSDKDNPEN